MIPQTPADVPAATVSPEQEGGAVPLVRLLGPIDVVDEDGQAHAPGSPLRRTILALLAVEAGQVVDAERLMDLAWNGQPPDSGLRALRFHISKLRGEVPDRLIETVGSGYRLEAHTDVDRSAEIDPAHALELWRGDPLADVEPCDALDQERRRLDELRLTLSEVGYERRLDRGEADELVAELTRVCEQHPLRERLWACLARAHAGAGHQAEALRAVEQLRVSLRDTLGADLSPPLKELERSLLDPESPHRSTSALPTGTVTFLFTDIVGSTAAWERDPEAANAAVERHDALLREVFERDGHVFAATGDGFAVVFNRAVDAVRAAAAAQRAIVAESWPAEFVVGVRVGIHTGEAHERGGNYFGSAVNLAARVMGAAAGGQVLVTESVRALVGDQVPERLALVEAGALVLRGVGRPVDVWTLDIEGIEAPTLPAGATRWGNVAGPIEALIGRDDILAEVRDALAQSVVVTLVGIGGVGKTSLARHVGATAEGFPGGVWLVPLAEQSAAEHVSAAVAHALKITPAAGESATDAVVSELRQRPPLLILDNCEHVIAGAADFAEAVAEAVPHVRILTTSREALHVRGERVIPVRPLDTDGPESAAAELFHLRAAEAHPGGATGSSADIAELCRRLDGLPLAIELAASRMGALRPSDVLEHLEERFRILTGGRRTAVERHQTLRATVGWSYDLLSPPEQRVLDRVSIFAGRFSLEDAVAIAGDDEADRLDVVGDLSRLVDRSLVDTHDDEPRFSLLETVRAFAREQLGQRGDGAAIARRHAERCRALAAELLADSAGPRCGELRHEYRLRTADQQEAVRWAVDANDLDLAVSIATDFGWAGVTWNIRDAPGWLRHLVDDPPAERPDRWAAFLAVYSNRLIHVAGDASAAMAMATEAVAHDASEPWAYEALSQYHLHGGRPQEALDASEAFPIEEAIGPARVPTLWRCGNRAQALIALGRESDATEAVEALESWAGQSGSPAVQAVALVNRGLLAMPVDPVVGLAALQQAVRTCEPHEIAVGMLAQLFLAEGLIDVDPHAAAAELAAFFASGDRMEMAGQVGPLRTAAALLTQLGEVEAASQVVRLVGGLVPRRPSEGERFAEAERRICIEIDDEAIRPDPVLDPARAKSLVCQALERILDEV